MMWEVEGTNEFVDWYSTLSEEDQDEMTARVEVLDAGGPGLVGRWLTRCTSRVTRT